MLHNILHPPGVFSQDFIAHTFGLTPPVLNILAKETHLRSHGGNAVSSHQVIILVTTHLIANYLVRISFHHAIREWSVLRYILEHRQIPWRPSFNIIRFASIVWPNEFVARSMTINNEFQFFPILSNEVS